MKLLKCPKGYIAVRVGAKRVMIEKWPDEERGYTIVDDKTAKILLDRGGYDVVSITEYPRDIKRLEVFSRQHLKTQGVIARINEEFGNENSPKLQEVSEEEERVKKNPNTAQRVWRFLTRPLSFPARRKARRKH